MNTQNAVEMINRKKEEFEELNQTMIREFEAVIRAAENEIKSIKAGYAAKAMWVVVAARDVEQAEGRREQAVSEWRAMVNLASYLGVEIPKLPVNATAKS